ncbi:MAG: hypothetical protein AB7I42_25865 [Bradyrhizobium sp.]|uniref:hypothetical protein n=1 Tax=Bradyrhizobium sp. TaxID=376 RepID=UPI003D11CB50
MNSDFDWRGSEALVFPTVAAIAIYDNGQGEIVIRQHGLIDDDNFVLVPHDRIRALITALNGCLTEE